MYNLNTTSNNKPVRVTFTVPQNVVDDLDKEMTEGNKSKFVTEALAEKIAHLKRVRALKRLAELPPAFPHIKDGAEYIKRMREEEDVERSARLGV